MKHGAIKAALVTVAAAATIGAVPMAADAGAAPATTHCSAWKQAGSTRYFVRDCAQVVHYKNGQHVKVTADIKNSGHSNAKINGFYGASWGQAGTGSTFPQTTVAPGHTKQLTDAFKTNSKGPFTATASITVSRHTATVRSTFKK